jgi:hypothetical protein
VKQTYTWRDLQQVMDLPPSTINNWVAAGLLRIGNPGYGHRRSISPQDMMVGKMLASFPDITVGNNVPNIAQKVAAEALYESAVWPSGYLVITPASRGTGWRAEFMNEPDVSTFCWIVNLATIEAAVNECMGASAGVGI